MSASGDDRPSRDLTRIHELTEYSLAGGELRAVLDEVLDQTLELLAADTAAVLLLEPSGRELVATAARGLEEEVRQGVRVPVGHGFAGRVASEHRPVVLDEVRPDNVWNPVLWEKGIRAMLGVPVTDGRDVVGVLHVGRLSATGFRKADVQILELVADRIATAARVRLLEAEGEAGRALQRSLLPSTPPRIGQLSFASRYVPSGIGGVGGDWYDVFQVDDGSIWIIVGDIAGHGFRAAVVMSRLRSAIRAYALVSDSPEEVLALTDRKVLHFEVDQMATVALVRVRPDCSAADVVLAGHPPPVLTRPGVGPVLIDAVPGLPLGITESERSSSAVELPVGSGLFLYTDGLIERRGEPLDVGLARLVAAVTDDPPGTVCARVMAALVGDSPSGDDIAILAARRDPQPG